MYVHLTTHSEILNDIEYKITLNGKITSSERWKFMIEVSSWMSSVEEDVIDGPSSSWTLSLKILYQVRLFLIDNQSVIKENLHQELNSDGSFKFIYKSVDYNWPLDAITIIKSKSLEEKLSKVLRKCNNPFGGTHEENITVWTDKTTIPSSLKSLNFAVEKFKINNNDEFTIHIIATTSEDQDRWFLKIALRSFTKNPTKIVESINFDPIDFLALRDYCI